jgi:hypothetical protein
MHHGATCRIQNRSDASTPPVAGSRMLPSRSAANLRLSRRPAKSTTIGRIGVRRWSNSIEVISSQECRGPNAAP